MAQLSNLELKEQEYRRLNEEMEHKTSLLMKEAEEMLVNNLLQFPIATIFFLEKT